MKISYAGFADEAGKTLEQQINATKLAGWSAIELRNINGANVCDLPPEDWKAARQKLEDERITVAGFGSQIANGSRSIESPLARDETELRRAIPYMKECGCNLIRIMSYPNAKEDPWPKEKWRDEVVHRLKHLAGIAGDFGITLGHENCSGYAASGPEEFLELISRIDHPAFKLIFDTGNNSEHSKSQDVEDTWHYYQAVKEHIVHIHIKGMKRDHDSGRMVMCFPDEDPVQKRILKDLQSNNYTGCLSIEPHMAPVFCTGDVDVSTAVYVEYAKRLEALVGSLQTS